MDNPAVVPKQLFWTPQLRWGQVRYGKVKSHCWVVQDPAPQTVQVNLGDIPGSLVDLGRPPLPAAAKAAAPQRSGPEPPQSSKDASVMEHRVAGDLMLGKMNKSMKKSMARIKSKKKGSHRSDGSARSRKSMANSDLQVHVFHAYLPIHHSNAATLTVSCLQQIVINMFSWHLLLQAVLLQASAERC